MTSTTTTTTTPSPQGLLQGLTTCIVGGGNSAHVLIPLLTEAGHQVHLQTRRPDDWQDTVVCEDTDGIAGEVLRTRVGRIHKKSRDPADVIPQADVIILCMPVHQYRPALDRLAPYINRDKEVAIGTVFGQAQFNLMVHSIEKKHDLKNVVAFAIGSIPWICRAMEYGKRGASYGPKVVNTVAVSPRDKFQRLNEMLLDDLSMRPYNTGKFECGEFLDMTLSVDNQILHPARCYGLWTKAKGQWSTPEEVPYFYRDFDQLSADFLTKLDDEYTKIRNAIKKHFPERSFTYMLNYSDMERLNHNSKHVDVLSSLRDSQQLAAIKTPVVEEKDEETGKTVYKLNTECRFFTDDIPYGLLIAKWLGERLDVDTPFIDEVITWAQTLRGEAYLDTQTKKINVEYCLKDTYTSGIPESYGITRIEDILD